MEDADSEPSFRQLPGRSIDCKSIKPEAYMKYCEIQTTASVQPTENSADTTRRRIALTQIVLCLLFTVPYEDRFFFNKVPRIIEYSTEDDDGFDIENAEKAFNELERYILLIAKSPWKTELHQIKLYNGFFKVKVEARLSRAVDVFEILGFQKRSSDWLEMRCPVNVDLCYKVAFDMFVASVECQLLNTVFRKLVPIGFKPVDIVKGRRYVQGNVQDLQTWLEQNCKPVIGHPGYKSRDYNELVDNIVELPTRQKFNVGEFSASKLYNKDIVRLSRGSDARLSGSKRTDSGYQTEAGSSIRSRPERRVPYRLTPDNYDTPRSASDDWFQEGTLDDHLAAASLMVQTAEPAKPPLKSAVSLGEYQPRAGAEWNYVRDGLIKRYGESYFQGERGDILAENKIRKSNFEQKVERGVDLEALELECKEAPTLPPRQGKLPPKTGKANITSRMDSQLPIYPPPLIARCTKPSLNQSNVVTDTCEGAEDGFNTNIPPRKPIGVDEKSAFFKDKLQDYERLNQMFPRDFPDLDYQQPMQDDKSWSCASCTFQNSTSNNICGMCGAKNSRNSYTRVCTKCTLENPISAKNCEACGKCLDSFETEV